MQDFVAPEELGACLLASSLPLSLSFSLPLPHHTHLHTITSFTPLKHNRRPRVRCGQQFRLPVLLGFIHSSPVRCRPGAVLLVDGCELGSHSLCSNHVCRVLFALTLSFLAALLLLAAILFATARLEPAVLLCQMYYILPRFYSLPICA